MRSILTAWSDPRRRDEGLLRRILPHGLFWRSLLIIVAPMVLLQAIVTYLFFERHFEVTTIRLSRALGAQIGILVDLHQALDEEAPFGTLADIASRSLAIKVAYMPDEDLPTTEPSHASALDAIMEREFVTQISYPVWFDTDRPDDYVDIRVGVPDGVLRVLAQRKHVVATNIHIFLLWMFASAAILIGIAVLFLRNQVRPIQRLAHAAEEFGKGREVPDFRPAGATEVRAAARAFVDMRDRLRRFLEQRTEMLAGVSHDLKTPLTRIKLELAMLPNDVADAMRDDVREMEHMLDEYLAFARGQSGENVVETDLTHLVTELGETMQRCDEAGKKALTFDVREGLNAAVRPHAIRRCIGNLLDNALKHGARVTLTARRLGGWIEIAVDDDGPGIPPERREEAFRPFHRLDQARNLDSGGTGLGLAIARDIARGHGGDVRLGRSELGGLRAELRLPV